MLLSLVWRGGWSCSNFLASAIASGSKGRSRGGRSQAQKKAGGPTSPLSRVFESSYYKALCGVLNSTWGFQEPTKQGVLE